MIKQRLRPWDMAFLSATGVRGLERRQRKVGAGARVAFDAAADAMQIKRPALHGFRALPKSAATSVPPSGAKFSSRHRAEVSPESLQSNGPFQPIDVLARKVVLFCSGYDEV
jgi:hypothetical protein